MKEKFVQDYTHAVMNLLEDGYVDTEADIESFKTECRKSAERVYNFLNENYSSIHLDTVKPCASLSSFVSMYFGTFDNLIAYLLKNQEGYAVSTSEAWDLLPEILGVNFALEAGYRHAYITLFNSPIHHENRIIEWAGRKTDETVKRRVTAKFQTDIPGIVILGLIAADNRLKASENYTLNKYIPWVNDCLR